EAGYGPVPATVGAEPLLSNIHVLKDSIVPRKEKGQLPKPPGSWPLKARAVFSLFEWPCQSPCPCFALDATLIDQSTQPSHSLLEDPLRFILLALLDVLGLDEKPRQELLERRLDHQPEHCLLSLLEANRPHRERGQLRH